MHCSKRTASHALDSDSEREADEVEEARGHGGHPPDGGPDEHRAMDDGEEGQDQGQAHREVPYFHFVCECSLHGLCSCLTRMNPTQQHAQHKQAPKNADRRSPSQEASEEVVTVSL